MRATGWDQCLVVTERQVVLGRLRGEALAADPTTPVETVMEPGPTTIRPDSALGDIVAWMREKRLASTVVTSSDGELIGVLERQAAEARLDPHP